MVMVKTNEVSGQKDRKMEINLSILITPNRIEGQPNDRSLRACTGFEVHGSHNLVYIKG